MKRKGYSITIQRRAELGGYYSYRAYRLEPRECVASGGSQSLEQATRALDVAIQKDRAKRRPAPVRRDLGGGFAIETDGTITCTSEES